MERRKQNRENYGDTSLTGRRKSVAPKLLLLRRKIKEPILMVNIIPDIIADPRVTKSLNIALKSWRAKIDYQLVQVIFLYPVKKNHLLHQYYICYPIKKKTFSKTKTRIVSCHFF